MRIIVNIPGVKDVENLCKRFIHDIKKWIILNEYRLFEYRIVWVIIYRLFGRCGSYRMGHYPVFNNKIWKHKYIGRDTISTCSICGEVVKSHNSGKVYEHVTDEIKEARYKYKNDIVQAFRQNEFSKEFRDANLEQSREMVKEGIITQKQFDNAKEVWKGDIEGF